MAIRLNQEGAELAQNLIKGRQYEDSDWGEAQPSAEEENRFIDENGWDALAKWHLAYDTEASEGTKSPYEFPFRDFKKLLHRSALIAARQRAGSEDYSVVQSAADRLLEMLPGENGQ